VLLQKTRIPSPSGVDSRRPVCGRVRTEFVCHFLLWPDDNDDHDYNYYDHDDGRSELHDMHVYVLVPRVRAFRPRGLDRHRGVCGRVYVPRQPGRRMCWEAGRCKHRVPLYRPGDYHNYGRTHDNHYDHDHDNHNYDNHNYDNHTYDHHNYGRTHDNNDYHGVPVGLHGELHVRLHRRYVYVYVFGLHGRMLCMPRDGRGMLRNGHFDSPMHPIISKRIT